MGHDPCAERLAVSVVEVLSVAAELHFVTEQIGSLGGARGTSEHAQRREVVEVGEVAGAKTDTSPKLDGSQTRPDGVLDRQSNPVIARSCGDSDEFGQPRPSVLRCHSRQLSLPGKKGTGLLFGRRISGCATPNKVGT